MKVHASIYTVVDVDPLTVLENINIINSRDWLIEDKGKYIHMTEVSAGNSSWEKEVGPVSKEIWDAWIARETLINYLKKQKS